jgi:hypothetical protein
MPFSRANPSPRYRELVAQYRQMHEEGERFLKIAARDTFSGDSLPMQAARVKRLIDATGASSLLDYGSGKGRQYEQRDVKLPDGAVAESIVDYWGVAYVHCYDPGYAPFSKLPEGKFDGVIATDVLEHCPEQDMAWIAGELFGFASRFVFANVVCDPARKRLPNGENAHCTLKPAEWWIELLRGEAAKHPGIMWEFVVGWREEGSGEARFVETAIRSGGPE